MYRQQLRRPRSIKIRSNFFYHFWSIKGKTLTRISSELDLLWIFSFVSSPEIFEHVQNGRKTRSFTGKIRKISFVGPKKKIPNKCDIMYLFRTLVANIIIIILAIKCKSGIVHWHIIANCAYLYLYYKTGSIVTLVCPHIQSCWSCPRS